MKANQFPIGQLVMDITKGFPNTPMVIIGYLDQSNTQKVVSVCGSMIGCVDPTRVLESSALLIELTMTVRAVLDDGKLAITGNLSDQMSLQWKAGNVKRISSPLRSNYVLSSKHFI